MGKHFGTDGVRGVAGTELTPQLAFRLGQAGAAVLGREHKRPVFVVGRDTRISGDMLEAALTAGILSAGGDVISAGIIPTPAVAYLARHYEASAGAVISASHNPFEYNGIKFFSGDGFKLDDSVEAEIEEILEKGYSGEPASGEEVGVRIDASREAADLYIDFLVESAGINLTGKKIVLDCANGAAYRVAPAVYTALGAEITVIGEEPDGININDNTGSTHPERLCETVRAIGADIGLAFDGDADRCLAVDENGNVIDGDVIMAICAKDLSKKNKLAKNTVVGTVMTNIGFNHFCIENGLNFVATKVGDRYVLEEMLKNGYNLGGEQSGHIIFLDYSTTGDGQLTAVQLLSILKNSGIKFSELAKIMKKLPQVMLNVKVDNLGKLKFYADEEIKNVIDKVNKEFEFKDKIRNKLSCNGRILVRASGTEPLIRVMLEGENLERITILANEVANLVRERLS